MQEVFEKIIEKLNCKKAYFKRFYECEGKSEYDADLNKSTQLAFDDAIEIVKQEAENFGRDTNVGSDGWIPCSSGALPKSSNEYCVTKMCENDENPIYDTCNEIFWTSDNKWDCERDEFNEWKVIAWKQKEKPYQPKGE